MLTTNQWFHYSFHVWSIPIEFRGSLIVYTALLSFSRCSRNARLLCSLALLYYFMYIVDGWFGALFMAGLLLSDLDLLAISNDLPQIFQSKIVTQYKDLIFYTMFVISLLLGSIPTHEWQVEVLRATPGWYLLSFLKPQAVFDYKWFFLFWAATFLVASVPRIWWLKSFFELRFNQYLGRISYAFYLVHGPIIWTLGDRLYVSTGWIREEHALGLSSWINLFPLSKGGPLGMDLAFLVPHLILLPFTLWVAEVVTKLVDGPSIRFSQWLYNRTLAPSVKA
jgi:peptidoglycan/LPS O-acetylase OafA/YrhL